jgi:hypothetical protein
MDDCKPREAALPSLTTPPKVAVNMPQATAAAQGTPARIPFMAPMTQKAPTPMASPQSIHSSASLTPRIRSRCGHNKNVPAPVTTHIHRYSISSIQNARRPLCSGTSCICKQSLKPGFHFIGSRVETSRFQAQGQLHSTCTLYSPTFAEQDVADGPASHRGDGAPRVGLPLTPGCPSIGYWLSSFGCVLTHNNNVVKSGTSPTTTVAPKMSIPRAAAASVPVMANTAVPK